MAVAVDNVRPNQLSSIDGGVEAFSGTVSNLHHKLGFTSLGVHAYDPLVGIDHLEPTGLRRLYGSLACSQSEQSAT